MQTFALVVDGDLVHVAVQGLPQVDSSFHRVYLTPILEGTVIWTAPNGEKHVTHPGGPLVFAALGIPPVRSLTDRETPTGVATRPP
jgi:hypothetical protein